MKKFTKVSAILLAVLMILASLTGCGKKELDTGSFATQVAATYGDEKIYMDEAYFLLMLQQWQEEGAYWYSYYSYYGITDMWQAPSNDGTNKSLGQYLREVVMTQMRQTRILCDHAAEMGISLTEEDMAKINAYPQSLRDSLAESFFEKYCKISDERIIELATRNALAIKVWDAINQEAIVDVKDEDVNTMSLSYVFVTEKDPSSDAAAATTAEGEDPDPAADLVKEDLAKEILARVEGGQTLKEAVEKLSVTDIDITYTISETSTSFVKESALTMKDGETQLFYSEGVGWYVITLHAMVDEEATAQKRAEVEGTQKDTHFNEVYADWAAASPEFKVNSVYEKLEVAGPIYADKQPEIQATTAAETTAAQG